jgi:hypothetical protein
MATPFVFTDLGMVGMFLSQKTRTRAGQVLSVPDKRYMFFTRSNWWFENPCRDTSDIYWVELKEYLPESHR